MTERQIVPGEGTPESDWMACDEVRIAPTITAEQLVPAGGRAVVVAPHPDDEVLAAGGLLAQLAQIDRPLCVLAVTDGTASHPGSSHWPAARLARERPREQVQALSYLGCDASVIRRLEMPDGGLTVLRAELTATIADLIDAEDVLVTPWRQDGHPDHEAVGHAVAEAAARRGARLVEVPVWGWHWARPQSRRLPLDRARRLTLDDDAWRRKQWAVRSFHSQLCADASTGAAPVLDALTLARSRRPFELVFV